MRAILAMAALLTTTSAMALTQQELDNWIEVMPHVNQWMDEHDDAMPEEQPSPQASMEEVFAQGIQNLKDANLYDDFGGVVAQSGFSSVEAWSEATADISLAMMAIQVRGEGGIRAQLEKQLAQLQQMRETSSMSDERIDAMESMLQASLKMIQQADEVDDATIELVKSRQNTLEKLMQ